MRLLGDLGDVQGRLDRLCDGLRTLLANEDAWLAPPPARRGKRSPPTPDARLDRRRPLDPWRP